MWLLKNTIILGLEILAISIMVASGISIFIKKSITIPLVKVAKATEIISNGDLTAPDINSQAKDEIGDLAKSFNKMKSNLKDLIISLHENANHLSSVSEELSASTEEVTIASTDVANRVEMTAEGAQSSARSAKESRLLWMRLLPGCNVLLNLPKFYIAMQQTQLSLLVRVKKY